VAWGVGSNAKTVIRLGSGVFYDRFPLANTLTARRCSLQRQYVISAPDFFPHVPPPALLAGVQSPRVVEEVSASMRALYIVQSAVAVERQLPWHTTVSVTYANAHGVHMLRSRNINAPLPGTFDPNDPGSGTYPYGPSGPICAAPPAGNSAIWAAVRHHHRPGPVSYDALQRATGHRHRSEQERRYRNAVWIAGHHARAGEPILPRNYGRGPGLVQVNIRISKTIGIGPVREASSAAAAVGSVPRTGGGGVFSSGGVLTRTRLRAGTTWSSRCRSRTSSITTIRGRSSETLRRLFLARPISLPERGTWGAGDSRSRLTTAGSSFRSGSAFKLGVG